jgi:hypothetical protein
MVLLALSLRELFNLFCKLEGLFSSPSPLMIGRLYLGPQFLLFLLTFKEMGSRMPKLLLGNSSILFEDVLGRRKYLTVEFFQHYNVFNTFLKESFTGVPGQKYVFNQQYQLTGSNNEIVDRKTWQQTVAKRSKVVMSVMLEKMAEEGVSCPRYWMPESSTKLGINVQWYSIGVRLCLDRR